MPRRPPLRAVRGAVAKESAYHQALVDLARFLDSPAPRLRWAFARRLSQWYGGDAPPPPDASGARFPGLDAVVAAWKARLAALP